MDDMAQGLTGSLDQVLVGLRELAEQRLRLPVASAAIAASCPHSCCFLLLSPSLSLYGSTLCCCPRD